MVQAEFVVDQAVAFLAGEEIIDEIDLPDRGIKAVGIAVLVLARLQVLLEIVTLEPNLGLGRAEGSDVGGESVQQLDLPSLQHQWFREGLRKKP